MKSKKLNIYKGIEFINLKCLSSSSFWREREINLKMKIGNGDSTIGRVIASTNKSKITLINCVVVPLFGLNQ